MLCHSAESWKTKEEIKPQTDWLGPEADTEQQVQLEAERNFQDTAVTSDNKVKYVRLIDWRKNNLAVSEEKEA